jgi:hypothetical protein
MLVKVNWIANAMENFVLSIKKFMPTQFTAALLLTTHSFERKNIFADRNNITESNLCLQT